MLTSRFALSVLFIWLAMAGGAGAALESTSHEAEHCLICEAAARLVSKTSSNCSFDALQRLNAEQQIIRCDLNNNIASFTCSRRINPSVSRYQVLRI
jgi:hypothetical protein